MAQQMNRAGTLGSAITAKPPRNRTVTGNCKHCGKLVRNRVYCSYKCRTADGDPSGKKPHRACNEAEKRAQVQAVHERMRWSIGARDHIGEPCPNHPGCVIDECGDCDDCMTEADRAFPPEGSAYDKG